MGFYTHVEHCTSREDTAEEEKQRSITAGQVLRNVQSVFSCSPCSLDAVPGNFLSRMTAERVVALISCSSQQARSSTPETRRGGFQT